MSNKVRWGLVIFAVVALCFAANSNVFAQGWDISGDYGFAGKGWNGGYWNAGPLVPGTYAKSGLAWGSLQAGGYGIGMGLGSGGAGLGVKLPGRGMYKLGW